MYSFAKNTYLYPRDTEIPSAFPKISEPKIIGSFSLNDKRCYLSDARNCKFLRKLSPNQRVEFDLNNGYENVVHKPESCQNEKIDHLLQFILRNLNTIRQINTNKSTNDSFLPVDVVCFRGLLRLIMCTPYENREAWCILATKFKGTIYLCALETDKKRNDRLNESEMSKRILSYGFKFEQYMLADGPSEIPNTDAPVIEAEEFCCMFSTKLKDQSILYGAEMDGIESDVKHDLNKIDLNQVKFIELKVKIREERDNQRQNYLRFKLRNWWCQCFLANIRKIIVGTRNKDGIVNEITEVDVRHIPKQVNNYWSPAVCMEFCSNFLQLVKTEMLKVNNPHTVYKFDYDPTQRGSIHMTAYENENEFSFLPQWYIEEIEKT